MAINTFTLKNGMRVILEENHSSKVVSFNALVKVGSAFEEESEAGICHVIEHMLFKGTPTRPAGTIAADVEAAGGDINAYTSLDQTVFYINMATKFADRGLAILADAIKNPLFDGQELAREVEVILEEMRREQDNPARMVGEYLFQTAYKVHTYGRPIIGYPKTVKSFTRDHLMDFYGRWYTPHNIVFIAVGDFNTKGMLAKIAKHFEEFKGGHLKKWDIRNEPAQISPRVVVKEMNVQSAYMGFGFHIPSITDPDVPALDLLSHILGGTESSRLEQEVKEKKHIVHSIFSCAYTPKFPGLLYIGAVFSESDAARAVGAIRAEVERLYDDPVTAEELSTAKAILRSNEIYEKETVGGQGSKIASFVATAGSHEFEKRYYQMMSDVQADDIRKAARRYLNFNNCSAVLIVPNKSEWLKSKKRLKAEISPRQRRTSKRPSLSAPRPKKIRLSNGATLIIRENHNLPIVSVCEASLCGIRSETKRNNGISGLAARLLTKGTTSRSAVRIAKDIEKLAGHIDGFSGRNTSGLKCEFLSEHLHEGLSLFADVLCHPEFSPSEVRHERQLVLKAIKDQEDNLSALAFAKFLETLFPKHPYGLRSLGTRRTVNGITRQALGRFHRQSIQSENTVISVVGDVNPREVEDLANEILQDMPRGKRLSSKLPCDPRPKKPREDVIVKRGKQQAHIVLGFQGTRYKNDDRYAMAVLNNVLSGQGGRLFRNLRDRMSLAYAVSSTNQEGIEPGYIAVYIGTEPGKIETAVGAIRRELSEICSKKITKDELERAKQYLVGIYELELQRNGALANLYTFYELYGLGFEEVDVHTQKVLSVTRDDVMRAARRYIDVDAYTMAMVKPA